MEKKPTDELNEILMNAKPDDLGSYLKENSQYIADDRKGFYYYMKNTLDEKNKAKLKKGKTYYVRVRACARDSDGEMIYGDWSALQSVIIKKLMRTGWQLFVSLFICV